MALPSRHLHSTQNLEIAVQSSDQHLIGQQASFYHPTASSQSFFQNAQNVELKDSQITSIANANVTINNNDPVTTILWPHVVAGAIFDSAAQYGAGQCHPGTRKKIIERIVAWIEDPDPTQNVLWIYGPAGAGKSAIAQTICKLLKETYPDSDGGSFFFSNGPSDRGNALKLFATLAYQLAIQFPSIRTELNNVLSRDPSLPTKSMEIQLLSLIIHPLMRCKPHLTCTPVLIIDGLDECDNDKGRTQSDIVALISKSVVDYNIPLRFMVFSRPEYWIRDAFDTTPLPDITLSLSLRDDVDADKDIKAYLTDEFERIRVENKRFMRSVVPPWPPTKIVNRFVEEASGQYIYAATVLKFVGNLSKFSSPQKQLDILIFPGPYRALAFSELDRLYATILAAYPQWETMKRVLAALLLGANTTIITVILGVDPDELVLVLDALSSLIDITKRRLFSKDQLFLESIFEAESLQDGATTISFCHRSFREFLQDKTRSGTLCVDLDSHPVSHEIANAFFGIVHRNLDQSYETEPHTFCNIDYGTYQNNIFKVTSGSIGHCSVTFLLPVIAHLTAKLEAFDPGKFTCMSSIFYFMRDIRGLRSGFPLLFEDKKFFEPRDSKNNPDLLAEFRNTCYNLEEAIRLACDGALSAFTSCTDFKPTPTLVYLTEYRLDASLPVDGLRPITGVTDVVSTLKQHRYIFSLQYDTQMESWSAHSILLFWTSSPGPAWRTEGIWRDLRISLAHRSLKWILNHAPDAKMSEWDLLYYQCQALQKFFDSRNLSDIANEEYFHNKCNLGILPAMTDVEAWIRLRHHRDIRGISSLPDFLISILCWINRQLTNPHTVTLLQNHNETLQQKLAVVMNCIFEAHLLQEFKTHNEEELRVFGPRLGMFYFRLTTINVWPLPMGFYERQHPYVDRDLREPSYRAWQSFHDEIFGKDAEKIKASIAPIIHPSKWHPHFLAALLKALVKFLYGQIHADFITGSHYEELFPYIIQCLPYAHPTPENLDALRAIVYLYPQVTPAWNPPEGLWPLIVDFLHQYDRSLLSSEELRLFVLWLNSTDHADINTYLDQ